MKKVLVLGLLVLVAGLIVWRYVVTFVHYRAAAAQVSVLEIQRDSLRARLDAVTVETAILTAENAALDSAYAALRDSAQREIRVAQRAAQTAQVGFDTTAASLVDAVPDVLKPRVRHLIATHRQVVTNKDRIIASQQAQIALLTRSVAVKDSLIRQHIEIETNLNAQLGVAIQQRDIWHDAAKPDFFGRVFKDLDLIAGTAALTAAVMVMARG